MKNGLLVLCLFMVFLVAGCAGDKDTENQEILSNQNEKTELSDLQRLNNLYNDFQKNKNNSNDAETDFYNSEFYNEFVGYLSERKSVNEDISDIGSKIGNLDLKGVTNSFSYNGESYNIRVICYNADYYVKNLTDSAMSNKNIYIQIYNDKEFYFYTICQRENNYLNDCKVIEYNGNIYIVILGSNGSYYPGSAFIGCLMWDGKSLNPAELLNLEDNDNIIIFKENNSNMCYTDNYKSCHVNAFNWYNSFNYNTEIENKFAFYGRNHFAYVVRYNNTDNEFTDLTFVTAEFDENNIKLSSESFEGVKTSIELVFENGKFIS